MSRHIGHGRPSVTGSRSHIVILNPPLKGPPNFYFEKICIIKERFCNAFKQCRVRLTGLACTEYGLPL